MKEDVSNICSVRRVLSLNKVYFNSNKSVLYSPLTLRSKVKLLVGDETDQLLPSLICISEGPSSPAHFHYLETKLFSGRHAGPHSVLSYLGL